MRDAYSASLVAAAQASDRVLLLTGDHGYALFDPFRRACPGQYLNCGVAEQNMVGVAAGLAMGGFRPVVYGLAAFVPMRVLEQIKLDVCYMQLPVIFSGDGAGVVYSTLGSSHQCTEDIAALRALPHMTVFSPADAWEMTECFRLATALASPVYLRMGKSDLGHIHALEARPTLVVGEVYALGTSVGTLGILATGSMVVPAREAARRLGPGAATVYSVPTLKPLGEAGVLAIAEKHAALVTIEEHSVYGGLGAAVAEIVAEQGNTPVHRLGIRDRFSQHAGTYAYLLEEHGLDAAALDTALAACLKRYG